MAVGTELWLVTPVTGLGIVQRSNGVDLSIIRPVIPGLVITSECGQMQIRANPSTKMAVLAEGLVMAVHTVVRVLLGGQPVLGIPEAQMAGRHPFGLVALVTLLDREVLVVPMGLDGRHEQAGTDQKGRYTHKDRLSYQRDSSSRVAWNQNAISNDDHPEKL